MLSSTFFEDEDAKTARTNLSPVEDNGMLPDSPFLATTPPRGGDSPFQATTPPRGSAWNPEVSTVNLDDFFPMLGKRRQKTEPLPDAAGLPGQGSRMNSAPLPPPLPNLPPIKTKVARTATAPVATAYAHDEGAPVGPDDMGQHVRKKRGYVTMVQEQPYVIAYPIENGSIPGVLQFAPQQLAGGVAEQQQYAYLNAAPMMLANQSFGELAILSDLVNTELANRKIASVAAAESHLVIPPVKLEAATAAAASSEDLWGYNSKQRRPRSHIGTSARRGRPPRSRHQCDGPPAPGEIGTDAAAGPPHPRERQVHRATPHGRPPGRH